MFRYLLSDVCEKEIARALGISVNTVHLHTRNIYGRLEVSGRIGLLVHLLHLSMRGAGVSCCDCRRAVAAEAPLPSRSGANLTATWASSRPVGGHAPLPRA